MSQSSDLRLVILNRTTDVTHRPTASDVHRLRFIERGARFIGEELVLTAWEAPREVELFAERSMVGVDDP